LVPAPEAASTSAAAPARLLHAAIPSTDFLVVATAIASMVFKSPGAPAMVSKTGELRATISRLQAELEVLRTKLGLNASPGDFLTLKQSAFESGFTGEVIRQWAVAGRIIAHRRGGQWMINRDSLFAFIGARRRSA
jgi:hypothetical protein